jgi:hypothetical protein
MKDPAPRDTSAAAQTEAPPPPHRRGRRVLVGVAAVVLLFGGLTVAIYSTRMPAGNVGERVATEQDPGAVLQLPTEKPAAHPRAVASSPAPAPTAVPPPAAVAPHPAPVPPAAPVVPPPPKPVETPLARLMDPSGSTVTFLRGGTVRVSEVALPADLSAELYRVYVLARVPDLPPLPAGSAEPVIGLTSPDPGDAGLETPTPVFRWTTVPGAAAYRFTLERLVDAASGEWQPVEGASGQTLSSAEWVVPGDAPLARGARYRWRVETTQEGDTLSSATQTFRVLDETEMRRLDDARNRYGDIPFLLGPHYEAFGLYTEAIWEYLKLARANSTSPEAQRALENARLRAEQQKRGIVS